MINRVLDLRVVSWLSNCAQNCAFGRAGLLDDWVRWENSASAGVIGEDQVGITGIALRLPVQILGLVDWRFLAIA